MARGTCRKCARTATIRTRAGVPPRPDRQPRRGRRAPGSGLPRARDRGGGRLLDRRSRLAPRPPRRRGRPPRPAAGRGELPQHPVPGRGGHDDRLRGRPPGLGLPGREGRVRGRLRGQRPRLRRPAPGVDRDHGGQDPREAGRRGGGPPARPGLERGRDPRPGTCARRAKSAFRSSSRRPRAAGAGACGWSPTPDDLEAAFQTATAEAEAAFSDGSLYVERAIVGRPPRRDPGAGRRGGRGADAGRARLLDPAPPSEARGGGPVPRPSPGAPSRDGGGRRPGDRGAALPRGRARSSSCSTRTGASTSSR